VKNPGSRFQVVDIAALNPGECLVTKTPNGPFIDTGVDLSGPDRPIFRGRVYLSVEAVREMAEQAGLFDPYEDRINHLGEVYMLARDEAQREGYAAGYAEKIDATADALVDRMRTRVAGDRAQRASEPQPAADAPRAEPAAESGAEAAVVEGRDDVPSSEPAGAAAGA
jgi:hypothetical protein